MLGFNFSNAIVDEAGTTEICDENKEHVVCTIKTAMEKVFFKISNLFTK